MTHPFLVALGGYLLATLGATVLFGPVALLVAGLLLCGLGAAFVDW
jgi:hypothetical protein